MQTKLFYMIALSRGKSIQAKNGLDDKNSFIFHVGTTYQNCLVPNYY